MLRSKFRLVYQVENYFGFLFQLSLVRNVTGSYVSKVFTKLKKTAHIVFITTSNLATNPRLVKEAELALSLNYKVSIICFRFDNWSLVLNEEIKKRLGESVEIIEIPAGRKQLAPSFISTGLQLLCNLMLRIGFKNTSILSQAFFKRSFLIKQALSKSQLKPDMVVAHNPGSFFPALKFAVKQRAVIGIDVEDYHPGEASNFANAKKIKYLMQEVLPQANYVSAAAPLILETLQQDCSNRLSNAFTIFNYFNKTEFVTPEPAEEKPLQCVWFSQNIDKGRGLEPFLSVLKSFGKQVQLHLYGNVNPSFFTTHIAGNEQVIIHAPVPQEQLHRLLAMYDVGVAIEDKSANFNRTICLTNKLLAYYQAGLFILATDTEGQQQFLKQYPLHGHITSLSQLLEVLQQLVQQKKTIRSGAVARYLNAAKHDLQVELKRLAHCWEQLIKKD